MSSKPADRPRPPSVEQVLARVRERLGGPRDAAPVVEVARALVAEERTRLQADGASPPDLEALAAIVVDRLDAFSRGSGAAPTAVINATGVIVHTNLGRAPWPAEVADAATDLASRYLLLELDRETGRRGARARIAEDHLVALTGADDALVTNNNAAALVLAVGLAGRGGVVVSRGELVEIGGGVRIPDIVRRAGAKLIEVGTTNRTRAEDFEAPLVEGRARAVLRVHPSNFAMSGFTETPEAAGVAEIAHRHGALVLDDLGSGALLDTAAYGLTHEPMPNERIAAGSDVVTFSGDKLVGGPQAGLIVGRADLIARMRRDPLARAMRPDKVSMAGVTLTLGLYRAGRATTDIPVWRMIATAPGALATRGEALRSQLGDLVELVDLRSTVGGGALPGDTLPSVGLELRALSAARALAALRAGDPPVIGRIADGRVVLDLRTVEPDRDGDLAVAIERAHAAVP